METEILNRMISYFGGDVPRVNHALKVYGFARALGGGLPPEKQRVLFEAAILHDIGIKNAELKYQSSSGELQELEGPPVARKILEEEGTDPSEIERICFLIGHHHSYDCIDGEDFQILVEADFLVNIYEEHLPTSAIRTIKSRIFKTPAGLRMIESLYGV